MTQPDGTDAEPQELDTHAASLDRIGDALARIHTSGQSTSVSGDAYGKLCVFITIPLGILQNVLTGGLLAASQSAVGGAERLRQAATAYRTSDQSVADRVAHPGRP